MINYTSAKEINMNEKLTAVRIDGQISPGECSGIMKKAFSLLFASGGITYSQFLFPYADSLLLSDDSEDCFFGSHALLWEIPADRLKAAFDEVCGEREDVEVNIDDIELTASSVRAFLGEPYIPEGQIAAGNFASLLSGNIRPWVLREHSRCLCSFAEHIARMKDHEVYAFAGGRLVIKAENADAQQLSELYASKTGGIAEFINL